MRLLRIICKKTLKDKVKIEQILKMIGVFIERIFGKSKTEIAIGKSYWKDEQRKKALAMAMKITMKGKKEDLRNDRWRLL